jgi:hypothetical protein
MDDTASINILHLINKPVINYLKWEGVVGTGWSGLRIGTVGGHL